MASTSFDADKAIASRREALIDAIALHRPFIRDDAFRAYQIERAEQFALGFLWDNGVNVPTKKVGTNTLAWLTDKSMWHYVGPVGKPFPFLDAPPTGDEVGPPSDKLWAYQMARLAKERADAAASAASAASAQVAPSAAAAQPAPTTTAPAPSGKSELGKSRWATPTAPKPPTEGAASRTPSTEDARRQAQSTPQAPSPAPSTQAPSRAQSTPQAPSPAPSTQAPSRAQNTPRRPSQAPQQAAGQRRNAPRAASHAQKSAAGKPTQDARQPPAPAPASQTREAQPPTQARTPGAGPSSTPAQHAPARPSRKTRQANPRTRDARIAGPLADVAELWARSVRLSDERMAEEARKFAREPPAAQPAPIREVWLQTAVSASGARVDVGKQHAVIAPGSTAAQQPATLPAAAAPPTPAVAVETDMETMSRRFEKLTTEQMPSDPLAWAQTVWETMREGPPPQGGGYFSLPLAAPCVPLALPEIVARAHPMATSKAVLVAIVAPLVFGGPKQLAVRLTPAGNPNDTSDLLQFLRVWGAVELWHSRVVAGIDDSRLDHFLAKVLVSEGVGSLIRMASTMQLQDK